LTLWLGQCRIEPNAANMEMLDDYRRFVGERSDEERTRCSEFDSKNLAKLRRLAKSGITTYDELIRALPSLPLKTRHFAAWLLGTQEVSRAAPALLQLVLANDAARGAAAVAIRRLENRKAIRAVARRAQFELRQERPSIELIESAVWCLKSAPGKDASETLLEIYEREDLPARIRGDAADALTWDLDRIDRRSRDYRRRVAAALKALQSESAELRFWTMFLIAQLACARTRSGRRPRAGDLAKALPALRRIAREERAVYSNLWPYSEEAKDAIYCIEHGAWPSPDACERTEALRSRAIL
jgi:hypothetical protein